MLNLRVAFQGTCETNKTVGTAALLWKRLWVSGCRSGRCVELLCRWMLGLTTFMTYDLDSPRTLHGRSTFTRPLSPATDTRRTAWCILLQLQVHCYKYSTRGNLRTDSSAVSRTLVAVVSWNGWRGQFPDMNGSLK
jgi:hypothetical protein